jgi:hypothetical protein
MSAARGQLSEARRQTDRAGFAALAVLADSIEAQLVVASPSLLKHARCPHSAARCKTGQAYV